MSVTIDVTGQEQDDAADHELTDEELNQVVGGLDRYQWSEPVNPLDPQNISELV